MRITLLDYGVGNLHSLAKAARIPGAEVAVEPDPRQALRTDALLLPGVGSFGPAAKRLEGARAELRAALADGLPCLAICLGMQLLLERSEEAPGVGIGLIPGTVRSLDAAFRPQIGWNNLDQVAHTLLLRARLSTVYYANSYVASPDDSRTVVAWSTHEADRFPAAIAAANTLGVQFHPEKSSLAGVRFLRTWLRSVLTR